MKVCKYCHAECDESITKCPSCGANEFDHKCPNCGTIYSSAFCPACGIKFDAKKHICPVCGNAFYTNACPSCGYAVNKGNANASTVKATPNYTKKKKKNNILLTILLWVFLFPIMVFVAIWKSQKLSKMVKIILTVVLAVIFLIIGFSSTDDTDTPSNVEINELNDSQNVEIQQQSWEFFESDMVVDSFFVKYNDIATNKIPVAEIERGNIKAKALVYMDTFNLEVLNGADDSLHITIDAKSENENSVMYELFRDCIKAMSSVNDNEIDEAWDIIHNGDEMETYTLCGAEIKYLTNVLFGENNREIQLSFPMES